VIETVETIRLLVLSDVFWLLEDGVTPSFDVLFEGTTVITAVDVIFKVVVELEKTGFSELDGTVVGAVTIGVRLLVAGDEVDGSSLVAESELLALAKVHEGSGGRAVP